MARILKVFAYGGEQDRIGEYGTILARYDAFVLLEPARGKTSLLMVRFPVEDITPQYDLNLGGGIRIGAGTSRGPAAGRKAARATRAPSPGYHHYLVQFAGPVKAAWLAGVRRAGGQVRELYRDFTYVVRANARGVTAISGLRYVRWVGHLPVATRLSPRLRRAPGSREPASLPRTHLRTGVYTVQVFDSRLVGSVAGAARRLGFSVLSQTPAARFLVVAAHASLARRIRLVQTLATVHGVKFIRARAIKRPSNDVAPELMGAHAVMTGTAGLSGRGEIVGVCDTGLDTGDPSTIHPDFKGRVQAIKSYPVTADWSQYVFNAGKDDGPADLDSGHGTHVTGSVLGSGAASAGITANPVRGLAYRAHLVFQAVEQEMWWRPSVPANERERFVLAGLPHDLGPLFQWAYNQGARVHSNSWGGGEPGEYDEQAHQLDEFIWSHPDFCVLVAAGNDGTDRDGDGRINPGSVTSPATAKNCITIGACESRRREFDAETYGRWWPGDYPVAPIKGDPMANNPAQVVAFSSRGPTDDGRIKPDVLAPGTFILSTRSTQIASNNSGWRAFPNSRNYFYMGGTSMATPLAAGAAALVRQYFRSKRRHRNPSAALVKAALIAGATHLPGTGSTNPVADIHQGFGRIDLGAVLHGKMRFRDAARTAGGLRTGESMTTTLTVSAAAPPKALRVVLAYSDYPGTALVNNLNVIVTAPDGSKYTSGGTGAGAGGPLVMDTKNNVEVVQVDSPAAGKWRLDVVGANVPQGPQDFAVVVLGASRVA